MREKWDIRRGWLKIHIAVDEETKEIVSLEITDESVSDGDKFRDIVEESGRNSGMILKVHGDGAYDTKDNFNILEEDEIESGIKTRKNATTGAKGSPYRAKCVRERNKLGYKAWADWNNYRKRWSVEGVFSAVKRIFGESVRANSTKGMMREAELKFLFYNVLLKA